VASIKCAHCKATHTSVDEVRRCAGQDESLAVASKAEREVQYAAAVAATSDPFAALEKAGYYEDGLLAREVTAVRQPPKPALPAPSPAKATPVRKVTQEELPAGRYALAGEDGVVRFYKVDHGSPRSKRWAGYVFLNGLLGSPGAWREVRLSAAERNMIMAKLADDPQAAASLFGQKYRVCGNCLSPLSKPQSRAAGYGHDCAANHEWPYPSETEALKILRERGEDVTA
jgi:hypothetical protein